MTTFAFLLGVVIGFALGVLLTCMFVIAREAEEKAARAWGGGHDDTR